MGNNKRRITKQKWYCLEEKKEIFKEKKELVRYYFYDNNVKTYIDMRKLKKKYTEKNYQYFRGKVFEADSNSLVKKNMIKCSNSKEQKYKDKRKQYLKDGLILKKYNKKQNSFSEFNESEFNDSSKIYRSFYPNEQKLIIKRGEFKKEINNFFGYVNGNDDRRKLKYYNDKLKSVDIDDLVNILKKYPENSLVDLENKEAQSLKKFLRTQIKDNSYKEIVDIISVFYKKGEKEFRIKIEEYFNNREKRLDSLLNASFETEYSGHDINILESKKNKINKKRELEKLSKLEKVKLEKLINTVLKECYKFEILKKKLEINTDSKEIKNIVKNHYKQNVKINLSLDIEETQQKLLLKYIHDYVKGRYRKLDKIDDDLSLEEIKNNVLKLNKLEIKIKNSIKNKIITYKIENNRIKYIQNKEFDKLNESLKIKLITPLNEMIYLGMKNYKFKKGEIEKEMDLLFQSPDIELFKDIIKNNSETLSELEKKFNLDKIEIKKSLCYIYLLRNYVFHFGNKKTILEKSEVPLLKLEKFIKKENILSLEYQKIKDNNVLEYVSIENVEKYLTNVEISQVKSTYLPRFDKVYNILMHKIDNMENIDVKKEQAIKYIWKNLYLNDFITDSKIERKYIKEIKNIKEIKSLEKYLVFEENKILLKDTTENIQRLVSSDASKLRKINNEYKQFLAIAFKNYLKDKKYLYEDLIEENSQEKNLEFEEKIKEIINNKIKKEMENIKIKNIYLNSIISLSPYISNNTLNKLINDLIKYDQFWNYLVNKYEDENIEKIINDEKEIKDTIKILELILKTKNNIKDEEDNKKEVDFRFPKEIKLLDIYNVNLANDDKFTKLEEVTYEYSSDEPIGYSKQEVLKAGEGVINFQFLEEEAKYGYLRKNIEMHINYYKTKNQTYKNLLTKYSEYYKKKGKETKIAVLQKEKKELYRKISKDWEQCSEDDVQNYKSNHEEILKYDFLKNQIYLKSITKSLRLQKDLYSRLMSWMYSYEKDSKLYLDEYNNFKKKQLKEILKYDDVKDLKKLENYRNEIMHLNYFQTHYNKKENKSENSKKTIIELWAKMEEFLKYNTKRKNDIKIVFANILEKFNIIVDYQGGSMKNLSLQNFSVKKHTKFNSEINNNLKEIYLLTQEEMEYLLYFIGIE